MRGLGELESVVMDRLWRWGGPVTVREMVDALQPERPLAYTTVATVLDNLVRKAWATRQPQGKANSYRPAIDRDAAVARLMREALSDSSDRQAAFSFFVEQMDEDESHALRAALRRRSRRRAAP